MKLRTIFSAIAALYCYSSALAQQPASPVRVDAAQLQSVQQLRQVTGNVRAVTRSRVAAVEPGQIMELNVSEGQAVRLGEPLALLDAQRLQIQLRQLQATMSVQAAILAERAAQGELRQSDLELITTMHERGAVNPKELIDARLELSAAEARRDQAQQELAVRAAEADLLNRRIADMTIAAPFDGMVVSKIAERGEWVAAGDPLFELVSTGSYDVWLDVPQGLTKAVSREGLSVMVHVDATATTYESQSIRIVGDIDATSRTFSLVVRISEMAEASTAASSDGALDGPAPHLAPGMSVTAWIPTENVSQQLTVNKDAVLRNEAGAYVLVVRDAGEGASIASPVPVDLVYALADRFVVQSPGLSAGDATIIEGGERLMPNAPVRVVGDRVARTAEDAFQGTIAQ